MSAGARHGLDGGRHLRGRLTPIDSTNENRATHRSDGCTDQAPERPAEWQSVQTDGQGQGSDDVRTIFSPLIFFHRVTFLAVAHCIRGTGVASPPATLLHLP